MSGINGPSYELGGNQIDPNHYSPIEGLSYVISNASFTPSSAVEMGIAVGLIYFEGGEARDEYLRKNDYLAKTTSRHDSPIANLDLATNMEIFRGRAVRSAALLAEWLPQLMRFAALESYRGKPLTTVAYAPDLSSVLLVHHILLQRLSQGKYSETNPFDFEPSRSINPDGNLANLVGKILSEIPIAIDFQQPFGQAVELSAIEAIKDAIGSHINRGGFWDMARTNLDVQPATVFSRSTMGKRRQYRKAS